MISLFGDRGAGGCNTRRTPGEGGWPLLDHGRINVDKLPVVFVETGHNTTGQFVFITKGA